MDLNMNQHDLDLWEQGKLKAFAVPQGGVDSLNIGQIVGIKEPFKRLTVTEEFEKDGETRERKVPVGVMYKQSILLCTEFSLSPLL